MAKTTVATEDKKNYKDSDCTGTVFPMENRRFSFINGIFSADHYSTKSYPVQILTVCDSVQPCKIT